MCPLSGKSARTGGCPGRQGKWQGGWGTEALFFRLSPSDYEGLHRRALLAYYGNALPLADSGEDEEEEIDTAAVEASFVLLMRWLHRQPEFTPEMLADKEVQKFIRDHTDTLDRAVDYSVRQRPMDDISIRRLKESNYVFSGFKTFHELNEAFPSLLDADGNRKPFEHFLNDVQKVNETYNRWYRKRNTTSPWHLPPWLPGGSSGGTMRTGTATCCNTALWATNGYARHTGHCIMSRCPLPHGSGMNTFPQRVELPLYGGKGTP